MPIDSYKLWNSFSSWANTFQGGFYRPQTDFINAVNDISKQIWTTKTDEAENNQANQDELSVFLKTKNCIVQNANSLYGRVPYPPDYGAFSSARLLLYEGNTVGDKDCETCGSKPEHDPEEHYQMVEKYLDGLQEVDCSKIDNSKWAACLSHKTKGPTLNSPKLTQNKDGMVVAPRRVSVVVMDYYTSPVDATFVYTISPGNEQTGAGDMLIYNQAQSTPLQWKDSMINEFVIALGERYGVFTREQFLVQAAQLSKKEN